MKSALEIRDAVRDGKMTALQAVEESLAVIKENDHKIGAFLEVFETEARERAKQIDEDIKKKKDVPRLAGVPIAIKDNILYQGHTASAGSKILENYKAAYNSTVVERLLAAGAIIIGRTNMDEFAMGSSTETSAFQKTRNPHNTDKVPGGSSGGSAAAVAAGMVPVALGSDTGGSIRQPAALCGVVGIKPTYGRVSRYGVIALGSSLDQIGVFGRNVADAALILEVIEGQDEHDATSLQLSETTVAEIMSPNLKGVKIGVPKEYFVDGMDERIRRQIEEAIESMRELEAEIVEISLPLSEYALPTYYIIQPAESSSNMARFDGMRYGTRAKASSLEESYQSARGSGFGREVKRRIMLGNYILSAGYYDAYYKKALAVKTAIFEELQQAFKKVDLIISPTSPSVAWDIGEKFDDPLTMYLADIFTITANLAGIPAISIPCGTVDKLPVGLQIMGPVLGDNKVLEAAAALEKSIGKLEL